MSSIDLANSKHQTSAAYLYIYQSIVVLIRRSFFATEHQHHAIQVVISLEQPFTLLCNGQSADYEAVIIPPDQSHQIQSAFGWHVTLLIEPESLLGRNLAESYALKDMPVAIRHDVIADYISTCEQHIDMPLSHHEQQLFSTQLLESLSSKVVLSPMDSRVRRVIEIIQKEQNSERVKKLDFSEIPLSKSRLAHLFVEQTGIPLRKYVLWTRIKSAVEAILGGGSLSDGAYEAGFSDLAHLSRTFKTMFGITMSDIFRDEETIKLIVPEK